MCLISIICPTYNCEEYIERTITSILNQSIGFENLEMILVDDCSTDSTRNIIKEFSERYENITTIFLKENHGFPGYGRNIGIRNSNADYIMFIDNDDEYESEYCETMYHTISSNKVDVVSTNFNIIKKDHIEKNDVFERVIQDKSLKFIIKNQNKCIIELNEFYYLNDTEVWNKIFKKDIIEINKVKFIENALNEDTIFLHNYYEYANNLMYLNYYGYKWYRDGDNLSYHSTNATLKFIYSFYEILEFTKKSNKKIDINRLFSFHIEETLINCLFIPTNDLINVLEELYKFEKNIKFGGELKHSWNNIINKFILKNKLSIAKYLIISIKNGRLIYKKIFK